MPIFDNYIATPFRWYDAIEKQNRYKDHCQGQCGYKLLTPVSEGLLPFVVIRPHSTNGIIALYIIDDNNVSYDANVARVSIYPGPVNDYLVLQNIGGGGTKVFAVDPPCGLYTAVMTDGVTVWFSEQFYLFTEDEKCHMKLEWWQDCDFNNVPYGSGFKNEFYFDHYADVGNRDYRDITEKVENGERKPITTFQRSTPIFTIDTGLVPDFVFEALKFMALHEHIVLTLKNNLGSGEIENVDVKAKWLFDDCFSNVTILFDLDAKLKDNCCDPDLAVYAP